MPIEHNDNLPELLSPKMDVIFKMLFGDERNKDLTIKFISSVLDYEDGYITDLAFCDPHLKRESLDDKLEILDVKAKLSNGEIIDIEIQVRNLANMRNRATYYKSNMITEQIGQGGQYANLKPVKCIIIADFDLIKESAKCHTTFQMLEKEEHFPFNDLEEIHVLSLKKLSQLKSESLLDWLKFINSEEKEEFMQLARSNPILGKAVEALSVISADETNRRLYEARKKAQRDEYDAMLGAKQEGEDRVLNLVMQGYTYEQIKGILKRQ